VLVLRALGLGDLLVAIPALRALRAAHPRARITLAAPAALTDVARLSGAVDQVLDTPGLGVLRSPGGPPSLAVNLHGRGPASTADLRRTRPARLIAHAHPAFPGLAGPCWRINVSEVDRWCALLRWHGVAADPDDLFLPGAGMDGPRHGAVIVHPGAAHAARRWPAQRFGAVAAALADDGHQIVVTGGADEGALADAVVTAAARPGQVRAAGPTSLAELAAAVADAALVVCGDTGVAHLATAYRVPSVLLFGPTSPAAWGPTVDHDLHVVLWHGETGDPFGSRPDPGLLRIGPAEVIAAARELLSEATARTPYGAGSSAGGGT
jgi:ADP-heptose:LPS heptosyltransferase